MISGTLRHVVGHMLWLVSAALGIFEMVVTHRVLSGVFGLISGNRWVHSALDRFGILILGLVGLGFVLFCEHYYREGVERDVLWRRFGLVTGAEVVLLICLTAGVLVV